MPGIYPNPSASAENFKVGDPVRWFVNENSISPYVGTVTEIFPSVNKVQVEFPVGGSQQKDPTELIIVPPESGKSTVNEDTAYDSIAKNYSQKDYGTLRDETKKMAARMVAKEKSKKAAVEHLSKMASRVAVKFADEVVTKLAADVVKCVDKGMSDIQTYQNLYPQYEKICSDSFMRSAITKIYKAKDAMEGTIADMNKYDDFEDYIENLKTWLGVNNLSEDRIAEEKRRFDEFKKKNPGK